eukprot:gene9134-1223_t
MERKYTNLDPIYETSTKYSPRWKLLFAIIFTFGLFLLVIFSVTTVILLDTNFGLFSPSNTVKNFCKTQCQPKKFKNGAVAADTSECSKVGAEILKNNGNAVDAIIATTFCQGVVSASSSGIGGGGILLVYNDTTKEAFEYDFRDKAPLKSHKNMFNDNYMKAQRGIYAIAVPGELKGMYDAWKKHGSLPWAILVQPSINLARNGHSLSKYTAGAIQSHKERFFKYTNSSVSDIKEMFAPGGIWYKEGDLAKYPKLADTLEKISQDPNSFYFGEIRDNLVKDIQAGGGIITKEDFEKYETRIRTPLSNHWHGHKILTSNPQFSGACSILGLNILEGYNIPKEGFTFKSIHKIVESMKFYFAYRVGLADPKHEDIEEYMKLFLSKDHATDIRNKISPKKTMEPEYYAPPHRKPTYLDNDHGTTHVSVVDKQGNGAALTTTVNLVFGSYIVSKSTGIILNDEMDDFSIPNKTNAFGVPPSPENFIKPEKRSVSSMTPLIVLTDNKLNAVIGASGGTKIISATFQVLLNILAFRMNIGQAVNSPRIHHQWYPNKLLIEEGYPFIGEFQKFGHKIASGNHLGTTQAVQILKDGSVEAISDYRKGGSSDGH